MTATFLYQRALFNPHTSLFFSHPKLLSHIWQFHVTLLTAVKPHNTRKIFKCFKADLSVVISAKSTCVRQLRNERTAVLKVQ